MAGKKSLMEKIVCHSEPITKGFEFCWTIEHFPRALSVFSHKKSPVFEALSHRWTIERQYHPNYEGFDVSLNLVDASGNQITKIPTDPLFEATPVHAKISFLGENGEHLMPAQVMVKTEPLKTLFNTPLLSCVNLSQTKLWEVFTGNEIRRVRMLFELRVAIGGWNEGVENITLNCLSVDNAIAYLAQAYNNGSDNAMKKIAEFIRAHQIELYRTQDWSYFKNSYPHLFAYVFDS